MASRMDRYYKDELLNSGRSTKNKSLYDQIKDLDSYTNIEGVATIEKTNEIDISKVKEMLKNRENYKKQKQLRSFIAEEKEEIKNEEEDIEEQRIYDIKDILSKMKDNKDEEENKYRSLKNSDYEFLKELKSNKKVQEEEKEELKDLLNTIASTRHLVDVQNSDDVGLLDELKSDTMVGDAASIKKILDSEKELKIEENTMELDKSFYTSSLGFTQSDFEELKDMNHKIKKSNKFIIILLMTIIMLIIGGIIYFLLNK